MTDSSSLLTRSAKTILSALQPQTQDPTLVVLNVGLLFRAEAPVVTLRLEGVGKIHEDAPAEPLNFSVPWEIPYTKFTGEDEFSPVPPAELVDDVRFRLQQVVISDGQPLWLRLVRPYGWLGTAPWERVLADGLSRPVLRLPDSPSPPSQRADVLQSALIVDPGTQGEDQDVRVKVQAIAQATINGSSRGSTQVHVFTTKRWYAALRPLHDGSRILVYEPDGAVGDASASDDAASGITAWTDWVVKHLDGQGLDSLYFLCRAAHRESASRIIVTSHPAGQFKHAADVEIDVSEFDMLMSRAGSWAAIFIPAQISHWSALSHFADAVARARPCAVLCCTLDSNAAHDEMLAACRLLFDAKALPAPVLIHSFLYCHPTLVQHTAGPAQPEMLQAPTRHEMVLARRAPITERMLHSVTSVLPDITATKLSAPPNWFGATQRFLESAAFDELRRKSDDVLLSKSLPIRSEARTSLDTRAEKVLSEIQGVVDSYLKDTGGY